MNARSRWSRPLVALAFVLGVVDVALLLQWWLHEPTLPVVAASDEPRTSPQPAPAAGGAEVRVDAATDARRLVATSSPTDTSSAVLYGTIARADGSPIADGVLFLYRDGAHVDTASPNVGAYALAGLRPGDYRIESRIDDALPLRRTVRVEAPRTRLDLVLEPVWKLTVHAVTPDGQPLLEALAKLDPNMARLRGLAAAAFATPPADDLPLSDLAEVSEGIGTFRSNDPFGRRSAQLAKQTIGVLTLPTGDAVHVALLLRSVVVAQQRVDPGQNELTFTIDPAQFFARTANVRLRVVDEHGAPVPDCQVSLNDRQSGGGGVKTSDEGRVLLEHVVPGRLRLGIMGKLQGPPLTVDVPPGAELDLGDITLRNGVEVAFVGDFNGHGSVRLTWLDDAGQPGRGSDELYLSAENGPTIRGMLYPGRYAAIATTTGAGALFVVDTAALPTQPMRIDLQPGAPLRVRGGRAGASSDMGIRASNGAWYRRARTSGAFDYADTLPLGSYVVTFRDGVGAERQHSVTLTRDGATVEDSK